MADALANTADVLAQANACAVDMTMRRWEPRYRLKPLDLVPTVIQDRSRRLGLMQWGWTRGDAVTRGDLIACIGAADAPSRCVKPFAEHRCLVMATAWFTRLSPTHAGGPTPIALLQSGLVALAALWKTEGKGDTAKAAVVLLTTRAHEELARLVTRMPIIIPFEGVDAWLNLETRHVHLRKLMQPYWLHHRAAHHVGFKVLDNGQPEGPDMFRPVEEVYR